MLCTPGCLCAGLAKPSSFHEAVKEALRLVGIETLAQGFSAGIL
jgi:hypothetical protein